jgi:phosphoesterase RecJ-like protein
MPIWGRDLDPGAPAGFDAVIVLDTCSYAQLRPLADWLRAATLPKLAIDHHVTRDELADLYIIDESAAATCLILHEVSRALDWPIDAEGRQGLFVGLAMDTGWFRHSNTDQRVLSAAADLVAGGIRPHELCQQLYQQDSPGRVRLLGEALGRLELLASDRLAVIALPAKSLAAVGATGADTEDVVNEPLRIGSVAVSVLLVEAEEGLVRASFRSKPPLGTAAPAGEAAGYPDIDVSKIAEVFGGGGHRRAAGARISGSLAEVQKTIAERLEALLR